MPIFLCLVLWEAHASSIHLDGSVWVCMAVDAGWCRWLGVDWERVSNWPCAAKHRLFEEGAGLTVSPFFFHLKVSWQLISRVSLSATCAVSLWFGGVLRVWSNNILIRAVCGESSVMFIEGVPPLPCRIFFVLWGRQEGESSNSPLRCLPDWYLPPTGGEPFSVANPLQVRMALTTKNRIVLF